MTPKKLYALLSVHMQVMQAQNGGGQTNKNKQVTQDVCIDQINW